MELKLRAKIIKGVGGLFEVRISPADAEMLRGAGMSLSGDTLICRSRGVFRHEKHTLLVGDEVMLRVDTELAIASAAQPMTKKKQTDEAVGGIMIEEALERKNDLIRPPMANLDLMFVVFAVRDPEPALSSVDKLITIAEYKNIEPVLIITKADLDRDAAEAYGDIYRRCGFTVFIEGEGVDSTPLKNFVDANSDKVSAFAGPSGVGKSTLMNRLFPKLDLKCGEVSEKTRRGKHTTRHVELYPLEDGGYLADTPGFGMLDFVQFDFYTKDDLPYVFREFEPYIGNCRYTKCTHTKEEGCALLEAVKDGLVPKERHRSYLEFYDVLKNKHAWDKK